MEPEALLRDITDYCRKTGVAESTFGRLAVNDGKFVNRLRDGGRITTTTFQRVRAYIAGGTPLASDLNGSRAGRRYAARTVRSRGAASAARTQGAQFPLLRQSPEIPPVRSHLLGEGGGSPARIDGAGQYPSAAAGHAGVRCRRRRRLGADARHACHAQPFLHDTVLHRRQGSESRSRAPHAREDAGSVLRTPGDGARDDQPVLPRGALAGAGLGTGRDRVWSGTRSR